MKFQTRAAVAAITLALLLNGCKKNSGPGDPGPDSVPDTAGVLKNRASFPIGLAIEYQLARTDAKYLATIAREVNSTTFGYQMKHGAIVRDDGSFNFATADELFNLATNAGLNVFGHTLVWH